MIPSQMKVKKPTLTIREIEIMKDVSDGYTSGEIAARRNLSVHTIRNHRKNILKKMGLNNIVNAVSRGIRDGWL
jgi:DNA-binding CsgD family transcriptional regulator